MAIIDLNEEAAEAKILELAEAGAETQVASRIWTYSLGYIYIDPRLIMEV